MRVLIIVLMLVSSCRELNSAAPKNISINVYGCNSSKNGNEVEITCPAGGSVTIRIP